MSTGIKTSMPMLKWEWMEHWDPLARLSDFIGTDWSDKGCVEELATVLYGIVEISGEVQEEYEGDGPCS